MSVTVAQFGNPCICSTFEVVLREWEGENGQPEMVTETTGCAARTQREFAPGHNSKLKSLLIHAGTAGQEVRRDMGGVTQIYADAQKAANGFGFAHMVRDGIERGLAKVAAKARRAARKADEAPDAELALAKTAVKAQRAAASEPAAEPVVEVAPAATVQIKVGKWEYAATIDEAGDAHYKTLGGAPATAVAGIFRPV